MHIYVASSWRNQEQPQVVALLRSFGHIVYDFKNPPEHAGFGWEQLIAGAPAGPRELVKAYEDPIAIAGFESDMHALRSSDACVLVMPAGISANLGFGFAIGAGKFSIAYLPSAAYTDRHFEPELMWKAASAFAFERSEIPALLAQHVRSR